MKRKDLLSHFAAWMVEVEHDPFLHDDGCRREIVEEYAKLHPENMTDPTTSINKPKLSVKTSRNPEVQEFIDECESLLCSIEDLPETCDAAGAWHSKVEGMRDWARTKNHITDNMQHALEGITSGVHRWT